METLKYKKYTRTTGEKIKDLLQVVLFYAVIACGISAILPVFFL